MTAFGFLSTYPPTTPCGVATSPDGADVAAGVLNRFDVAVVQHRDVAATTEALHAVLTRPGLAASMTAASGRIAPTLEWPAVADSYHTLAASLIGARTEAVA